MVTCQTSVGSWHVETEAFSPVDFMEIFVWKMRGHGEAMVIAMVGWSLAKFSGGDLGLSCSPKSIG